MPFLPLPALLLWPPWGLEPAFCTELTARWALLPKFCPFEGRREPLKVVPLRFSWGPGFRSVASPAGPGLRGLLVTGLRGSGVSDHTSRVAPSKWPQRHLLQAPGLQLRWGRAVSLPALPSPRAPGTTFPTLLSHQQELWVTVTWATVSKSNGARFHTDPRVLCAPQATFAHDLEGFGARL